MSTPFVRPAQTLQSHRLSEETCRPGDILRRGRVAHGNTLLVSSAQPVSHTPTCLVHSLPLRPEPPPPVFRSLVTGSSTLRCFLCIDSLLLIKPVVISTELFHGGRSLSNTRNRSAIDDGRSPSVSIAYQGLQSPSVPRPSYRPKTDLRYPLLS
jgi:hypothetical protein